MELAVSETKYIFLNEHEKESLNLITTYSMKYLDYYIQSILNQIEELSAITLDKIKKQAHLDSFIKISALIRYNKELTKQNKYKKLAGNYNDQ